MPAVCATVLHLWKSVVNGDPQRVLPGGALREVRYRLFSSYWWQLGRQQVGRSRGGKNLSCHDRDGDPRAGPVSLDSMVDSKDNEADPALGRKGHASNPPLILATVAGSPVGRRCVNSVDLHLARRMHGA